jgi:cyclohexadienyl dehydratase
MAKLLAIFLISCCWTTLAYSSTPPVYTDAASAVLRVSELMAERLRLMPEVAAWKLARQLPVQDAERERQVLSSTVLRAQALGIQPAAAERLFALQIELARRTQQQAIERWRAQGTTPPAGRTLEQLRPVLDELGTQLLQAIYLALPRLTSADFDRDASVLVDPLLAAGLARTEAQALLQALDELQSVPSELLVRVRASGIVRIGTTGDYAPFTLERAGMLEGADIELALALAASLDAQPRFIATSWSTLLQDFAAGRFDLAVGGISITAERAAQAAF